MTGSFPRIRYVTVDTSDADALAGFWTAALGYVVAAETPYLLLKDPRGHGPHLHLQRGDAAGEPRLHLDLFTPDRAGELPRLERAGAVRIRTVEENGMVWDVLRAPGGQVFCLFEDP